MLAASQFEEQLAGVCLLADWFECHRNGIKLFAGSMAHHSVVARNKIGWVWILHKVVPVITIGHDLMIISFPADSGIVLNQFGPHGNQAIWSYYFS